MNCEHEWEQVWFERVDGEWKLTGPERCRLCRQTRPVAVLSRGQMDERSTVGGLREDGSALSSSTSPLASPVRAEPPAPQPDEAVEAAAAQLVIEIAFLVPRGTDLRTHPISRKLEAYKLAVEKRARAASRAVPPAVHEDETS